MSRTTCAFQGPATGGAKVTLMAQLPPGANVEPQVLVCEKTAGEPRSPVMLMGPSVSVRVPVLVRVTDWTALEVPTGCGLKMRLLAENVAPRLCSRTPTFKDPAAARSSLPSPSKSPTDSA